MERTKTQSYINGLKERVDARSCKELTVFYSAIRNGVGEIAEELFKVN